MDAIRELMFSSTSDITTPLTVEETQQRAKCEAIIAGGLAEFVRVGNALLEIAQGQLFRETHRNFESYCRDKWGLARRTAYQKMQAAETYETVRNYAQFPPQNEYQALQLALLPTKELQQQVWAKAIEVHEASHRPLTGRTVRALVRAEQAAQQENSLETRLEISRTFPGIPFQWSFAHFSLNKETQKTKIRIDRFPLTTTSLDGISDAEQKAQLVLVNPDSDLFLCQLKPDTIAWLLEVLESAPSRTFLFWTDQPHRIYDIAWPANVEFSVRIHRQQDIDRLATLQTAVPFPTLWLLPEEPLTLPKPLPFTRVLIGNSKWAQDRTADEITKLRQLVGWVLTQSPAIHIATALHDLIYQYRVG